MSWKPINLNALESLVNSDLDECSKELRTFFAQVRIVPTKWRQSPWGVEGGGFWAVAVYQDHVLWYNDIEGGFNVSRFVVRGEIPDDEYWCNQDPLQWALPRLAGNPGINLGPPMAVPEE
jgi:hypothetical protein